MKYSQIILNCESTRRTGRYLTCGVCSPVVVLLGQDQNNQSAVVVLGDEEDRRDIGPGDDISAVIGELNTIYGVGSYLMTMVPGPNARPLKIRWNY